MHFLITAGPTREYLDPVRFLSNASTGKMGYACAAAAVSRGHKVTLVSGSVNLPKPKGARLVKVTSCEEMDKAVRDIYETCDCVIMTAAVCDYRPMKRQPQKISKGRGPLNLKLEKTRDILEGLGRDKAHQVLIGFALQDRAPRRRARDKMKAKNLDVVVVNNPAALGAEKTDVQILSRGGKWLCLPGIRKDALAGRLVRLAETVRRRHA